MYYCKMAVPTLCPVFTIHRLNIILKSSFLHFSVLVCAPSTDHRRFARSSHRFHFVASFSVVSSPIAFVSLPPLLLHSPSSHRRFCLRRISVRLNNQIQ
ncbi:Uncharacterized protein APZ42_016642 [Daphnia magna]|uniref:Uncharacterized protein n=1 Tax=Daphnia magna TaxID=35525 RepID=A0A165ABF5_9CRUS|nr:Uncharacterized protein APZ42_016642 [Daphnia magna]